MHLKPRWPALLVDQHILKPRLLLKPKLKVKMDTCEKQVICLNNTYRTRARDQQWCTSWLGGGAYIGVRKRWALQVCFYIRNVPGTRDCLTFLLPMTEGIHVQLKCQITPLRPFPSGIPYRNLFKHPQVFPRWYTLNTPETFTG